MFFFKDNYKFTHYFTESVIVVILKYDGFGRNYLEIISAKSTILLNEISR